MRAALCHEIHAFACLDANLGVWAWQGRERDVHRAAFASLKDTVLGWWTVPSPRTLSPKSGVEVGRKKS